MPEWLVSLTAAEEPQLRGWLGLIAVYAVIGLALGWRELRARPREK